MPEKFHRLGAKSALFKVKAQIYLPEAFNHLLQPFIMLFFVAPEHQHIIEVAQHAFLTIKNMTHYLNLHIFRVLNSNQTGVAYIEIFQKECKKRDISANQVQLESGNTPTEHPK
jgi:hypothetical protein